ncbi:hypothetical protein FACS189472_01640 [Alphaproteobacteria bacterium]|nr:hypothetical protein FACS189472_01640 [Alphaproteobacteria bacterium]
MSENSLTAEVEAAKREAMRIRFRKVWGETVPSHTVKEIRRKIAKCVKELDSCERGQDA